MGLWIRESIKKVLIGSSDKGVSKEGFELGLVDKGLPTEGFDWGLWMRLSLTEVLIGRCSVVAAQEVEQLRMERLHIDEQLRQIGMGLRPSSGRPADKEKGYGPDEPPPAPSLRGRSYTGRARGRRGPNYTSGYGKAPPTHTLAPPTHTLTPPTNTLTPPTDTVHCSPAPPKLLSPAHI